MWKVNDATTGKVIGVGEGGLKGGIGSFVETSPNEQW
jgi:hypothetical protein